MNAVFEKSSTKRSINITISPMMAARIDDSVSEEMNIPTAMYIVPQKKMPM